MNARVGCAALAIVLALAGRASGAIAPGFSVDRVAATAGFLSRFAVHHSRADHTADLISLADLDSGSVTELAALECNHGQRCSSEHHGGHLVVLADGSIPSAIYALCR